MTTKQKVLSLVRNLGEDVTIDQVIDRLYLLKKVQEGIQQADAGDVIDHDDFMNQLE